MSNEAKTTKAYKISTELKEKLERLAAESGLETQEAFIEQLAALYELQQLKEGNGSGYAKQIDELEYHTRRSVELFVGVINTEAAERMQLSQQHDEKVDGLSVELSAQQDEIAGLKKELKEQAEHLVRISKENESQVKLAEQLEASVNDKAALVEEYRQRIDTLSGLINDYKAAAEENKKLSTRITELTTLSEKMSARVGELEEDLATLETIKSEQLRQQEERHRESSERLSERKDVEKERELLAIRSEYQTKLEKSNEEATAKIRELYAQIERLRTEHEQQIRELQQPKGDDKSKK